VNGGRPVPRLQTGRARGIIHPVPAQKVKVMPDHPIIRQPLQGEVLDAPRQINSPVEFLELVSFLMDRCFVLPGTDVRFGLNAIFLLLPVLGDVIPGLVSLGIIAIALHSYRVPRIVAARMVINSLLDISIGWIPVVGDLFDMWFKADTRNVRLLQQYIGTGEEAAPSTWRHWLFVIAVIGGTVLVLVLLVLGVIAFIHWVVALIRGEPTSI
jgi:Domain of unknown function (DUF4112)